MCAIWHDDASAVVEVRQRSIPGSRRYGWRANGVSPDAGDTEETSVEVSEVTGGTHPSELKSANRLMGLGLCGSSSVTV